MPEETVFQLKPDECGGTAIGAQQKEPKADKLLLLSAFTMLLLGGFALLVFQLPNVSPCLTNVSQQARCKCDIFINCNKKQHVMPCFYTL